MAALTQARDTGMKQGDSITLPVLANAKIYAGAIVVEDSSGWAKPGVLGTGLKSVGIAKANADNTGGGNGAISIAVENSIGQREYLLDNDTGGTPVTAAMVLGPCYILDDHTVTGASAGASVCGVVRKVTAQGVWVRFPQ